MHRLLIAPLALLALACAAAAEPAAGPAPAGRVEIPVEVRAADGKPLRREPTAADFAVSEGGEPRRIVGLEPLSGEPWRIVIYVDRVLSSTRTLRAAAGALAEQAVPLAGIGTVEVVVAEPEPRVALAPTRDAAALDEALSRLFLLGEGRDDLREGRARARERIQARGAGEDPAELADEAAEAEARLARRQQARLAQWLAGKEREGPRVLFLVSDGFDLDPRGFYVSLAGVPEAGSSSLQEALAPYVLERDAAEAARLVAALGWTAYALPLGDDRLPEVRRWRPLSTPQVPIGVGVTLPGRRRDAGEKPELPPLPALANPHEPLRWLAEASGGEVLTGRGAVAETVAGLRRRLLLAYQTPRPAAGPSQEVEVRALDPKLAVRARRWDGPLRLDEVAALRALEILDDGEAVGDLDLSTELRPGSAGEGALAVRLEGRPPPAPGALWRLTLAGAGAEVSHRRLAAVDLVPEDGVWTYRTTVPLPAGAEPLAVVVEDLASGLWGAAVATVAGVEAEEETAGVDAAPSALPVARQGEPESGAFAVRIVEPAPGRSTGAVEVEAEVRAPAGRQIERVEFFWNEELAGTLYAPPFRQRVRIPSARPAGYVRVLARLDDGSAAEDAVPLNTAAAGERVDVRLVQLFVVVTDRAGKPVRGLPRDRFTVRQDGAEQEIATFENAGELPLTVALAIDSSASMFRKLEDVRKAAASLLRDGLTALDKALLVDFDTHPRLVAPPTRNLGTVASSLELLRPDGSTALWEAVAFSLSQLAGVRGRKALIVYSDGVDEGEPFPYRESLRLARRSGVPVYLIVTGGTGAGRRTLGGFLTRSHGEKMEALAAAAGGRAYFVRTDDDLGGVYREILSELRSQYTLAYYPKEAAASERHVRVEVEGEGLTARTVSEPSP